MMRRHALTIDLEEWYHAELVRKTMPAAPEDLAPAAVRPILQLLRRQGMCATFFIVGEVAERHPDLVREIAEAGHEIACHSYSHRPLWELTPAEFAQELDAFRRSMGEILGSANGIIGYRAPTFSLDAGTAWALDVLRERDFHYDSSIFPLRTPLYGVAGAPLGLYRIQGRALAADAGPAGTIIEAPVSAFRCGPARIPAGGGTYLRLVPRPILRAMWRRIARERPLVLYLHPWETYPATPHLAMPPHLALATYAGMAGALRKLEALMRGFSFSFAPLREVLEQEGLLNL